jgi:uncharacterized protein YjaZ
MRLRNYSPQNYIDAINNYPKFWESIRANTFQSKNLNNDVEKSINQLKTLYPELKPTTIYFTIGSFRTNGTILKDQVLIGCEMALADKKTVISELPENLNYYYSTFNPIGDFTLLITHEHVHTVQKDMVDNLLSYCLYEGVAEFVCTKALDKASYLPAIEYGKFNEAKVKKLFENQMFNNKITYDWLWSSKENSFKTRDIGYYIGYAICENYYNKSVNKQKAIKEMIELDYSNTEQFEQFVDKSGYFSTSLKKLYKKYEKSRPKVVRISQFKNKSQNVDPNIKTITLNFSKPMDKNYRGFDFGPLGENNVLRVQKVIGFSEDGKSFSFEVEIKPNQRYQSIVSNNFCDKNGVALQPYLIDITTSE